MAPSGSGISSTPPALPGGRRPRLASSDPSSRRPDHFAPARAVSAASASAIQPPANSPTPRPAPGLAPGARGRSWRRQPEDRSGERAGSRWILRPERKHTIMGEKPQSEGVAVVPVFGMSFGCCGRAIAQDESMAEGRTTKRIRRRASARAGLLNAVKRPLAPPDS